MSNIKARMRSAGGRQQTTADEETRAIAPAHPIKRWLRSNGAWVLILDIVLIGVFTATSPYHVFWSAQNFQSVSLAATQALLLALGIAMMMGAGIFDLSVGSNLVLCSVIAAKVMEGIAGQPGLGATFDHVGLASFAALAVCLVAGATFGLVNGLIIAFFRVSSLISTLGTMGIGTGLALIITNGGDIGGLPPALQERFALKLFAGVPLPTVVALVVALGFWATLRFTRFGTYTLALGSSRVSASRAGINVRSHIIKLMMLGGLCAGLAGFVDISRYSATSVAGHAQDGLTALTAVVIGGTTLAGGRVNILGAIWGAALSVILLTGLIVSGVAPYYQLIVIGGVLIAAVILDSLRTANREGR